MLFGLAPLMVGCALAGCGSNGGPTVTRVPVDSQVFEQKVPLVSSSTQAKVQAAVGDANHAMLLTNEMTADHRTAISGATVVDGAGATTAVSLPELESATLVPWAGGYAVGGANCVTSSTEGVEHECIDWFPTVAFLHPDGSVEAVVTGTEQKGTNDHFVTVSPGGETVIFQVREHDWETVDAAGFKAVPGAQEMSGLCRLFDGTLVGVTVASSSSDLNQADDVPGTMHFSALVGGKWRNLGVPATFDPAKGTSSMLQCVVGGFVTTLGVVSDRSGFRAGALAPKDYGTPSDTVADAVGFDPTGRLYVAIPPAENQPPQVLGGSSPVIVHASDRWVGLSADGMHVLLGGQDNTRIGTTT